MTRKLLIFLLFIMIVNIALIYSQTVDSIKKKRIIISTSLFEYIASVKLNTGNFNIGTEINLKNKNSLYTNIGLIRSYGQAHGLFNLSALKTQGYKIQLEGKQYLKRNKIVYFAAHSFYQSTKTDRQGTVVDYIDDNPFPNSKHYKINKYQVDRNVFALIFKFGFLYVTKFGLSFDNSVGLGGIYITSKSTNRLGEDTDYPYSDNDYPWKKLFDKGSGLYPNFVYQFRIGWRIL